MRQRCPACGHEWTPEPEHQPPPPVDEVLDDDATPADRQHAAERLRQLRAARQDRPL